MGYFCNVVYKLNYFKSLLRSYSIYIYIYKKYIKSFEVQLPQHLRQQ